MQIAAQTTESGADGVFATTHWNLIVEAGGGTSPAAEMAMEQICRRYWYPVYAFVRRSGHDSEQAKDLVQGFFEKLLEKNYLAMADPAKGRFRSFLLGALKHYLSDERKYSWPGNGGVIAGSFRWKARTRRNATASNRWIN